MRRSIAMSDLAWLAVVTSAVSSMGVLGCRGETTTSSPEPAPSATPALSTTPAPAPAPTAKPHVPCRVLAITGHVSAHLVSPATGDSGAPLLYPSADIPIGAWLELPAKAKLTAKDPRSARETTFVGPARAKACVHDEEESWLASGTFESSPGAGETLGAEEWVAGPLGVVRYASAGLSLAVTAESMVLRVDKGTAFVAAAADARAEVRGLEGGAPRDAGRDADGAWTRVDAPAVLTLRPVRSEPAVKRAALALDVCVRSARETRSVARQLAAPDAALGELAPRHVASRRAARASCAIAEVRAEGLAPSTSPQDRDRALIDKAHEASASWRALDP